ncbi:hypothetical protein ACQU0X_25930 [Pseudovibrio ascidiaceicola]|uniref:hypothetical protein n=1 Tax=Pseudovibrio ascidiaceicola TaxID=285279 RepID=UPI003D35BC0B
MQFEWERHGVMEPDFFVASGSFGEVELHQNWDEESWLLCRNDEDGLAVIYDTETPDIHHAKVNAETWLNQLSHWGREVSNEKIN